MYSQIAITALDKYFLTGLYVPLEVSAPLGMREGIFGAPGHIYYNINLPIFYCCEEANRCESEITFVLKGVWCLKKIKSVAALGSPGNVEENMKMLAHNPLLLLWAPS